MSLDSNISKKEDDDHHKHVQGHSAVITHAFLQGIDETSMRSCDSLSLSLSLSPSLSHAHLTFVSFNLIAASPIILDLSDDSDALSVLLRPVSLAAPVPQGYRHFGCLLPRLDELFEGGTSLRAAGLPTQCHHDASQYRTFPTCGKMVYKNREVIVGMGVCERTDTPISVN